MEPPEIIEIDSATIACDGGGGALGHPRVFLNMGDEAHIDCPYCGRHYVLNADAAAPASH
ncbi:MAG: zinc-finger domain-containing protein [Alphaproteobacteria bacterium]|nr:zinc-finger domain-containing protein [Alphaproteobacteria bacterium]